MEVKRRCLVYLRDRFQDLEFVSTLAPLKRTGLFEIDLRGGEQEERELTGQYDFVKVSVKPLRLEELDGFDSLILIGGSHCKSLRNDKLFKEVATHFFKEEKEVFAICDGPNVLYEFGLIEETTPYTSYPSEELRAGRAREGEKPVVVAREGKLITARDPASAFDFSLKIIEVVVSK